VGGVWGVALCWWRGAPPPPPPRPLTSVIAGEMGEVVTGSLHYSALFVVGLTLFVVTFLVNLAADLVLERQRARWRR
jgi:phosphate transport system permease protein